MKRWECTVCGYIHEGDEPPDECPLCGADKSQFVEVKETVTAAAPARSKEDAARTPASERRPVSEPLQGMQTLIDRYHLHPITVHIPNGIIPMAVVFVFLLVLFGSSNLGKAALYSYVFVLLSMPAVLFTGYTMWRTRYQRAMTRLFKIKITASIIATVLLATLVLWGFGQPTVLEPNSSGRAAYLFFSLIMLAAVGLAGHLGGKLVFGSRKG